MEEEQFVDEFLDRIYICGSKEDDKYILTLSQATQAAKELFSMLLYAQNQPGRVITTTFVNDIKQ